MFIDYLILFYSLQYFDRYNFGPMKANRPASGKTKIFKLLKKTDMYKRGPNIDLESKCNLNGLKKCIRE